MRTLRTFLFVFSSSVFGFAACSSSSASLGNDVDAGSANDAAPPIDSGLGTYDSGPSIIDSGVDSGPRITGDFSCAGAALPTSAPASITIAGTAVDQSVTGQTQLEGVSVSAYPTQTSVTASSNASTESGGAFSLIVGTGEVPVDGYLKATVAGEMDSYLYANAPLATSQSGLLVVMLTPTTYQLLVSGVTQDAAKGVVAVIVLDCESQPVSGATVTTSAAGTTVQYNKDSLPNPTATSTAADGIAYVFNVPTGDVTINASAGSNTLRSHHIISRSSAFTSTLITP